MEWRKEFTFATVPLAIAYLCWLLFFGYYNLFIRINGWIAAAVNNPNCIWRNIINGRKNTVVLVFIWICMYEVFTPDRIYLIYADFRFCWWWLKFAYADEWNDWNIIFESFYIHAEMSARERSIEKLENLNCSPHMLLQSMSFANIRRCISVWWL